MYAGRTLQLSPINFLIYSIVNTNEMQAFIREYIALWAITFANICARNRASLIFIAPALNRLIDMRLKRCIVVDVVVLCVFFGLRRNVCMYV